MPLDRSVFRFNSALVREPAPSIVNGLRAVDRSAPDFASVRAECDAYAAALVAQGVAVERLPPLDGFPDSIFVEDTALVFAEGAILLRPGAATRFGEAAEIQPALHRRFSRVLTLPEPGFVEGGDVLVLPDRVLIGLSARTDEVGAAALVDALSHLGREGLIVRTPADVLHFKSACSLLDETTILSTERLSRSGVFAGLRVLVIPEGEEAVSALRVNEVVLVGAEFPRTRALLEAEGYPLVALPIGEIAKVDAGLSCLSLRWWAA